MRNFSRPMVIGMVVIGGCMVSVASAEDRLVSLPSDQHHAEWLCVQKTHHKAEVVLSDEVATSLARNVFTIVSAKELNEKGITCGANNSDTFLVPGFRMTSRPADAAKLEHSYYDTAEVNKKIDDMVKALAPLREEVNAVVRKVGKSNANDVQIQSLTEQLTSQEKRNKKLEDQIIDLQIELKALKARVRTESSVSSSQRLSASSVRQASIETR